MAKLTKRTKKKVAKKASTRKKTAKPRHHPDRIETQIQVWDAYVKNPSRTEVAKATGISEWIVRRIVDQDQKRLLIMLDDRLEQVVSKWEARGQDALEIMDDILRLAKNILKAIDKAAQERSMTVIEDEQGYPMPVLNASQWVVMSRMLDQIMKVSVQSISLSTAYRKGESSIQDKSDAAGGIYNFASMSDPEILKVITESGLELPYGLKQKVKMLQDQASEKIN